MNFNNETVNVLKNFSTINPSLVFDEGSTLMTLSPKKNILAKAELSEQIPLKFGIYDLNQFLGTISLFNEPNYTFHDLFVEIENGVSSSNYFFCNTDMIDNRPSTELSMPDVEVRFELQETDLKNLLQAANVLQLPDITVTKEKKDVVLTACNIKDATSNNYKRVIKDSEFINQDFERVVFMAENFKMLPTTYEVKISAQGISHFVSKDGKIQYWVATEG